MAMKTILHICAGLLGAMLLSGCTEDHPKSANIQTETASHSITFQKRKNQLTQSEYGSLNAFVKTVPMQAVTYAAIATDDTDPRAFKRARSIRAYLIARGVEAKTIHLQAALQKDTNTIELTLQYAKALPPDHCPDWSDNSWIDYNNPMHFSNFGCSYYNDIAVQMQNPGDYAGASAPAESDATRDSVSIQKYRTGATPAMATTSASTPAGGNSAASSTGGSVSSTGSTQ